MSESPRPTRLTEETLFATAVLLTAQEQRDYVERACAANELEPARVFALLRHHVRPAAFLETPAAEAVLRTLPASSTPPEPAPGDRIGRFQLLEQLGEGGFGIVFLAEQREPVRRRVALKLVRLGLDTREFIARFEAERQAMALMEHPNIARVFDAGATEHGRPYLVMELVHGMPITTYCDQHRLPLRARLELFIAVCGAIQHAHQKSVIHRDLKPSNILVTGEPGAAVPKVIDFGIAKALAGPLTDKTLYTRHHAFVGTPGYTSPEQLDFGTPDVDTRSDVYSLGALLYELLCGRPPFERDTLNAAGFEAMQRVVRETEPKRPSQRVKSLPPPEGAAAAKRRGVDPAKLPALLANDLDWIVMRCLEKDRRRRYETANALSLDLQRHLKNEPVIARPPSRRYRAQKFVRRYRTSVLAAAAILASLVGGLLATGILLVRERAAAAKSRQVAQFMKDMLGSAGPSVARGRDTTLLREVLDDTIRRLDTELRDQPEVAADLRHTLGVALREIGDYDDAAKLWREAIAARRALGDARSAELAATLHELGSMLWRINEVEESELALEEALRIRRETLGPEHFDVGTTLAALGRNWASQRPAPERVAMLRHAVAIQRRYPDREDELAQTLTSLGFVLTADNANAEAALVLREAVDLSRRRHGDVHPQLADALNQYAYWTFLLQPENPDALNMRREALQIVRQIRGPANARLVAALLEFATCRFPAEVLSSDLRLARDVFAELQTVLPSDSPDLAVARLALAALLDLDPNHAAEAEMLTREGVTQLRQARANRRFPHRDTSAAMQSFVIRMQGEGRIRHARPMAEEFYADTKFGSVLRYGPPVARFLGYIYYDLGLYDRAIPLLEKNALAQKGPERSLWRPAQRAHLLTDYAYWGDALRREGRIVESRRVLEAGVALTFDRVPSDDPAQRARAAVRGDLGYTAIDEGNFSEAEALFREALAEYDAGPRVNRWGDMRPRGRVAIGLGRALAAQGKFTAAEPVLLAGYAELADRRHWWGDHTLLVREGVEALIQFYRDAGMPEQAAEWERKRATP